jgi:hypothetical protein
MMNSRFFLALMAAATIVNAGLVSADAQSSRVENTRAVPVAGASNVLNASERPAAANDSAYSYDSRALRFESSWGSVRIIRGADGQLVGTSGWFRDIGLEKIVATSPTAVTQARLFEKNNFRGSLVGTVGAFTTVVGLVLTTNGSNGASSPSLIIAGTGAMLWGAQHLIMSYSALSQSLWWYNRELPR